MRFHTKLIITYSLIVMIILVLLSFLSIGYSKVILEESAKKNFIQIAKAYQQKINYAFSDMTSVCDEIKQNEDIQNQLVVFQLEEKPLGNRFSSNALLRKYLLDVNNNSEIYRINVFNDKGDFLSTNEFSNSTEDLITIVKESEWYQKLQAGAEEVILSPHYDSWLASKHVSVYSIVKPIKKNSKIVGFVETQRLANEYSQITEGVKNDALIAIFETEGKVFYSNKKLISKKLINHYRDFFTEDGNIISIAPNIFSNIQEMIATVNSEIGWTIVIVQNYNNIFEPARSMQYIVLLAAFALMAISFVTVYIFTKKMTVPLRKLKSNIEMVTISNLNKTDDVADIYEHDEVKAIQDSFLDMQKRLKESMEIELRACSLQVKAHFDALQARINPHFMFNMLGIIVNLAEEAEHDEIGDVCQRLSKILRYTTQASDSLTTITEEINHTEDYLLLMKSRFEHRLIFRIDVDERLNNVIVPKFLIQPLIENSLSHGFINSPLEVMQIQIMVRLIESDKWELRIEDNGSGFKENVLMNLNERIQDYEEKVFRHQKPEELSIGGMGLINTLVRLKLYFGDKAEFEIGNLEQGGALLLIRLPIEYKGRD